MLLFPILADLNIIVSALDIVPKAPCCLESLGVHVCYALRNRNPVKFMIRCTTEADFAMLQCCHTCETKIPQLGQAIFQNGTSSQQCFDRISQCTEKTCSSTVIAFRACRKSCGYCDPAIYSVENSPDACPFIG